MATHGAPAPHGCAAPRFATTARPGEYVVFQLAAWALRPLTNLTVSFAPLLPGTDGLRRRLCAGSPGAAGCGGPRIEAESMRCVNTHGVSYLGAPFTKQVDVTRGRIQPLYVGIAVPANMSAAGALFGSFTVQTQQPAASLALAIELTVAGAPLRDHGDSAPERLSRVRWLDSTVGIDDQQPLRFEPLRLDAATNTASGNGKRVSIDRVTGLPARVAVVPEQRHGPGGPSAPREVLAEPIQLHAIRSSGATVRWCAPKTEPPSFRWTKHAPGVLGWSATAVSCPSEHTELEPLTRPGRLGAVKRPWRFPIEIHFVWRFCMGVQSA